MIGILVAAIASNISASEWQLELQGQSLGCPTVLDDEMELNSERSKDTEWVMLKK